MARGTRDRRSWPTRRDVLAGGLALAGTGLAGGTAAGASRAEGLPARWVLMLDPAGPSGAASVLARATPLLAREGLGPDAVDLVVAEGYRPPGFSGRLLAPSALMALPTARLAALLSPAGAAQIAASWPVAPLSASQALERLAALLPLVPDGRCWVVALRGLDQLSEADRLRFQASLAPFARGVTA